MQLVLLERKLKFKIIEVSQIAKYETKNSCDILKKILITKIHLIKLKT